MVHVTRVQIPRRIRFRRVSTTLVGLLVLFSFGVLTACSGSATSDGASPGKNSASGTPLVLATTPILGDLVRQVGGDAVDVEVLIPLGADPHDFEPSAAQAARLRKASLIVANGLGLEKNLKTALDGARKDGVTVFEVGEQLDPLMIDENHDAESAADSHDHGTEDPHVWLDPERMSTAASLVAEQLATATGLEASGFQTRADAYRATALAAMAEANAILAVLPNDERKLITNHDALAYFAQRFNLDVIGTVIPGGSTLAEPSAADLTDLVRLIKANNVRAIFSESTVSSKLIETVSREVGARVQVVELSTDTLGTRGTETATYAGLIVTTARLIANGLTDQ